MRDKACRETVRSVDRGLEVLEILSTAARELGTSDVSHRLGLATGSVARLIAPLVQRNHLARDPAPRSIGSV